MEVTPSMVDSKGSIDEAIIDQLLQKVQGLLKGLNSSNDKM